MTSLIISCLKIFCCRIMDVSLGTMRTVLTVKEKAVQAALIGFCEVFIWYIIVKDALNSDAPVLAVAIAYAGGYATGTYIGGKISKKLIKGHLFMDVITSDRNQLLLDNLRREGFAITVLDANGSEYSQEKYLILADIDKRDLSRFEKIVSDADPKAFIVIKDTKSTVGGYDSHRK